MLTLRLLRIEDMEKNYEVKMMKSQEKRMEVCRVQLTMNGPLKLILTKPWYVNNAMPYNHRHISNTKTLIPLLQVEMGGLTRSDRCFTPEKPRKTKGKEVIDFNLEFEVNKLVTKKETNEFLKLIKHNKYYKVN